MIVRIRSEDWLFELIENQISVDDSYSSLFRFVRFKYLSSENVSLFHCFLIGFISLFPEFLLMTVIRRLVLFQYDSLCVRLRGSHKFRCIFDENLRQARYLSVPDDGIDCSFESNIISSFVCFDDFEGILTESICCVISRQC
jgi:hypothetical protein